MKNNIIRKANQMLNGENGHELTFERAYRLAREEAEEKAAEKARRLAAFSGFRASLLAAGVAQSATETLIANHADLPEWIQIGKLVISDQAKAAAVKAAIRNLWIALGYSEPDFSPFDREDERNRKPHGWINYAG